jgi:hypothetical protein
MPDCVACDRMKKVLNYIKATARPNPDNAEEFIIPEMALSLIAAALVED